MQLSSGTTYHHTSQFTDSLLYSTDIMRLLATVISFICQLMLPHPTNSITRKPS